MKHRIDMYTPGLLGGTGCQEKSRICENLREKKCAVVEAARRFLKERGESLLQLITKFKYSKELL